MVLVAAWGILGTVAVLVHAIARLTPLALEPIANGALSPAQAVGYAAWVVANAYVEGYRGFQRSFAPRTVARALALGRSPRPVLVAVAPLVCMGLLHATRRRLIASWALVVGIVAIVLVMETVPQPYRGIVDGGVIVGLAWGTLALLVYAVRAARGVPPAIDPDLPPP